MDDYSVASLSESKNEWCARLVNVFTPAVVSGLRSIFEEAWQLCLENDEEDKYLITFQTFLSRVPKWNNEIIEEERKRIVEVSSCGYLEDLVTCVHVIQLKALTCIRVGQEQKKVNIDIPSVDQFVHRVYINVARKVYTNVYLFEKGIAPLQIQKHNRELEIIIKECIMNTIRETMPIEDILRAYMSETHEEEVNVSEEVIEQPTHLPDKISFNDTDTAVDVTGIETEVSAPKTVERLERIALEASERRKAEEVEDEDDMPLKIGEEVRLELADINDLNRAVDVRPPPAINIETL